VLERKWAHARFSLKVVWILLALSVFFGLVFWGGIITLIVIVSRPTTITSYNSNYNGYNG
jgi:hypothetical protein